jgi:outer membrane protein assembly factor BamE (lipoprotein component of BamABCDE complex)
MKNSIVLLLVGSFLLGSCQSRNNFESDRRTTVGTVQREIRKGMSGADVAAVMGSPNIVTSDENGGETWIYDKFSSNVQYSQSSGGVGANALLIFGGFGKSSGSNESSQRTLTVVIKFNESGKVRDFKYHTSRF